LLGFAAFTGKVRPPAQWAWVIAFGLANTTLGLSAMFVSVGLAGAALPAVLANSQALLVAPFAALFFGERLTRLRVSGLAAGVAGVGLVMLSAAGGAATTSAGLLVSLVAAIGLASGNLIMKHIGGRVDGLTAVTWHYAFGGLALLLWSLAAEDWSLIQWTGPFVSTLLFLGLAGSAGTTYVWYRLVQRSELISLNALTLLIPIISGLLALAIYHEPVGVRSGLGALLVIGGVTAVAWPTHSPARFSS